MSTKNPAVPYSASNSLRIEPLSIVTCNEALDDMPARVKEKKFADDERFDDHDGASSYHGQKADDVEHPDDIEYHISRSSQRLPKATHDRSRKREDYRTEDLASPKPKMTSEWSKVERRQNVGNGEDAPGRSKRSSERAVTTINRGKCRRRQYGR